MIEEIIQREIEKISTKVASKTQVNDTASDSVDDTYSASKIQTELDGKLNVEQFKTPTVVQTITGTLSAGALAGVQTILDGNEYHVDEVTGTPGFEIHFTFTNVTSLRGFVARLYYNGSATHEVTFEIYREDLVQWDTWIQVEASTGFNYYHIVMPNPFDYIRSTGEVLVRLIHNSAGNASHDIHIDYVGLIY